MKKFIVASMIVSMSVGSSCPVWAVAEGVRPVFDKVATGEKQIWTLRLPSEYKLEGMPDVAHATLEKLKADYLDKLKAKYPSLDIYKEFYAGDKDGNKYLVSQASQAAEEKVKAAKDDFVDAVQKFNELNKSQGVAIQITDPSKGEYVLVQMDPNAAAAQAGPGLGSGSGSPASSGGPKATQTAYAVSGDSGSVTTGSLGSKSKPDTGTTYVLSTYPAANTPGNAVPGAFASPPKPGEIKKSPGYSGSGVGVGLSPVPGGIKPIIAGHVKPGGGIKKFPGADGVEKGSKGIGDATKEAQKIKEKDDEEVLPVISWIGGGGVTPATAGNGPPAKPEKPVEPPYVVD